MRACVVLPTYNEAGSLREVIEGVLGTGADVLVVDDNSPDGTGKIADDIAVLDARVTVIHRPHKMGLGPAYIAGFHDVLSRGYDAAVEMDSALSHDPADVARLITEAERADLVIGSRYVPGGDARNWNAFRRTLSRGASLYTRTALRLPVRDATSGFRCYRREVLEELPLDQIHSEGYGFQVEMAWRTWLAGFCITEIPITFVERREGASKMSRAIVFEAAAKVAGWAMRFARPKGSVHPRSICAR